VAVELTFEEFCWTRNAYIGLQRLFANRLIEKQYLALVVEILKSSLAAKFTMAHGCRADSGEILPDIECVYRLAAPRCQLSH